MFKHSKLISRVERLSSRFNALEQVKRSQVRNVLEGEYKMKTYKIIFERSNKTIDINEIM